MKKVLFSLLAVAGMLFAGDQVQAQQNIKIGVFDIEQMIMAMPGYRAVDSALQVYQSDSLASEYDIYQMEYRRLDSTYKADSAAGKSKAVLDYSSKQRQQVGMNLIYWQQIAQQKLENKRGELAQPLYEQVATAYKKILAAKKYTLVLKPEAIEGAGTDFKVVDNIFELVAKELKIPLQGPDGQPVQHEEPAKPQAKPKG